MRPSGYPALDFSPVQVFVMTKLRASLCGPPYTLGSQVCAGCGRRLPRPARAAASVGSTWKAVTREEGGQKMVSCELTVCGEARMLRVSAGRHQGFAKGA